MMLPVRVDFPESTWPMKTMFTFSLAKKLVLRYLEGSQLVANNFWMLISGSPDLTITFYFYSASFTTLTFCYCLGAFGSLFFFLSSLKS